MDTIQAIADTKSIIGGQFSPIRTRVLTSVHADALIVHMDTEQQVRAIAERARLARKRSGLTQEELSRKTRIAPRSVRRKENAETDFTTSELIAWAAATDTTFQALMLGDADEMRETA